MHYAVLCNAPALLCITGVKWINVKELSDILGEHSSADDPAFNHSIFQIYLELHFGEYLVEIKTSKMTSEDTQTMTVKCRGSLTVRAAAPIVDTAGVDCGHPGDQQQGEGGEGGEGAGVARRGHVVCNYLTATVTM